MLPINWNENTYGGVLTWYAHVDVDRDHWYNLNVTLNEGGYDWSVDYADRSLGKPYHGHRAVESLDPDEPTKYEPYEGIDPLVTHVADGFEVSLKQAKNTAESIYYGGKR